MSGSKFVKFVLRTASREGAVWCPCLVIAVAASLVRDLEPEPRIRIHPERIIGWPGTQNRRILQRQHHEVERTIKAVATFYGIPPEEIAKPRWRTFARQHQVVMWTSPDRKTERQV